jgi:hypothetical protein
MLKIKNVFPSPDPTPFGASMLTPSALGAPPHTKSWLRLCISVMLQIFATLPVTTATGGKKFQHIEVPEKLGLPPIYND